MTEITVGVEKLDAQTLFFWEHVADMRDGAGNIVCKLERRIPDNSLVIRHNGERYLVDATEIVRAIMREIDTEKKR